jgi:hypothetical protein
MVLVKSKSKLLETLSYTLLMVMPSANSWTMLTEQVQLPDSEQMEMSDCNQWTHSQRCGLLKSALMQKDQEDKEPLHVWHQTHQMAEVLSQQSLLMDLK